MLSKLKFSNFKCYKNETSVNFKQVTLLSGRNNAGKSTIAQLLLLLSQTMRYLNIFNSVALPTLQLNNDETSYGSADELLNDKNKPLFIELTFDNGNIVSFLFQMNNVQQGEQGQQKELKRLDMVKLELKTENDDKYLDLENKDGSWEIHAKGYLMIGNNELDKALFDYINQIIPDDSYNDLKKQDPYFPYNGEIYFSNIKNLDFYTFLCRSFTIDIFQLKNCINETIQEYYNATDFYETLKQSYSEDEFDSENIPLMVSTNNMTPILRDLYAIYNIEHIQAFRGMPQRIYYVANREKNPLLPLLLKPELKVPYLFDYENQKSISGTLEEAFDYWICREFKLCEKIEAHSIVPDLASEIILWRNNTPVRINNVGFGVSQLIPLVITCLITDDALIIIDEPESHLHPGLQSKVGEFILTMAKIGKRIIVETHSEHIINKLNYYSLKYDYLKNDIYSYWIYEQDKTEKIEEIKYDKYGFIHNPPEGFYDQTEITIDEINEIRFKLMNNKK